MAAGDGDAYVANLGPATVSVVDPRAHKVVATVPDGVAGTTDPFHVTVSRGIAYVVDQDDGDVAMIDTWTHKIIATIPVGSNP